MQEKLKQKLLVPSTTCWNSFYDAIERVVENSVADLNDLCAKLDIRCFNEKEIMFLKEYCAALNHSQEDWIYSKVKIIASMVIYCQHW